MTEQLFGLAILCTANRFRSPLAAALIQAEAGGLPVRIRSFAASGPSGAPPLPQAVERGRSLDLDLSKHRATRLERGDLAAADLVIGFERSHIAAAVIEGGASRDRAFTLPEFVALAEGIAVEDETTPIQRARIVVRSAAAARAALPVRELAELRDPAGGPQRGYEAAATQLADLSRRLVRALFEPDNS